MQPSLLNVVDSSRTIVLIAPTAGSFIQYWMLADDGKRWSTHELDQSKIAAVIDHVARSSWRMICTQPSQGGLSTRSVWAQMTGIPPIAPQVNALIAPHASSHKTP